MSDRDSLFVEEGSNSNGSSRRRGGSRTNWAWIVGGIVLVVVVGLIIWAAVSGNSSSPSPAPTPGSDTDDVADTTQCRYSTVQVANWVDRLDWFYKYVLNYANNNFFYTCDFWSDFSSNYSALAIFPLANNADYQSVVALRDLALAIKADPAVTTLEKIQVDQGLADVEYYLNLTQIDHFVNQLGVYNYDYAWLPDRFVTSVELMDTLTEDGAWGWCNGAVAGWRAGREAEFEHRVSQWIHNVGPMLVDYLAAFQHQVAVNKTHAGVTMDYQQSWYDEFGTHDYTNLCAIFTNATLAAQCATDAAAANTAKANFIAYFDATYVAAAHASRPDDTPGIIWLQNGTQAYQILINYHLGYVESPDVLYNLGTARIAQNRADMLSAANEFDVYADFPALVVALGNTADPRYFFCNTSDEEVISYFGAIQSRVMTYVHDEFGYLPRVAGKIIITGSPSTYNFVGSYDETRHLWLVPYTFNIGDVAEDPEPNGCSTVYQKFDAVTLVMHESFPGHGLQTNLQLEISCRMSRYQYPPTGFVEGFALYVETLGFNMGVSGSAPLGLYSDPIQKLGHYSDAMLRDNRLQEDPALSGYVPSISQPWSYSDGWNSMMNNGFTVGYSKQETERYITMPGQATAYMVGRIKLLELRNFTQTSLGPAFSPAEFHNIITRYGGASLANVDKLVHTYVEVKLSGLPAADASFDSLFGIDLVRVQFSASLPVVGLGPIS